METNKTLGIIIIAFITMLVGIILFQTSAQSVGETTNLISVVNETFETPANGTAVFLTNVKAISGLTVQNASNDVAISSGNYTVTNNVVNDGALAVRIVPDASAGYRAVDWELNYTGQKTTYISDSGGRAMANLILIFFGLAVMAVGLALAVNKDMLKDLTSR